MTESFFMNSEFFVTVPIHYVTVSAIYTQSDLMKELGISRTQFNLCCNWLALITDGSKKKSFSESERDQLIQFYRLVKLHRSYKKAYIQLKERKREQI